MQSVLVAVSRQLTALGPSALQAARQSGLLLFSVTTAAAAPASWPDRCVLYVDSLVQGII